MEKSILFMYNILCFLIVCIQLPKLSIAQSHVSGQLDVKTTATHGMVIDAGSGGSRLHVFTWQPRVFYTLPPPLSYPEANEKWTARISPGIQDLADDISRVATHLAPLIDFAKISLAGFENDFQDYPIYFKATGGMRELTSQKRDTIINEVRRLLNDKSFCPFYFRDDLARVISGEEEAVYSWAATNFLMGTLLPNSQGIGEVENVNSSYGTLDLGGASTQIAYYVPSQDILEGLYKLQLGGQKSWNVYTKSFLQFGIVSARLRFVNYLVDKYIEAHPEVLAEDTSKVKIENPCFHSGYSEVAKDSSGEHSFEMVGPDDPLPNQLVTCRTALVPLLEITTNSFCDRVFHGDCSITGTYQPPLPTGDHGHFIGTSAYVYPWSFLMLPTTASLIELEGRAKEVCQFSFSEVMIYYENHDFTVDNEKTSGLLPYYCFLSSYVLTLLEDGYRFQKNQTLTVKDQINGHKVGWALGAILYEINELPWELHLSDVERHPLPYVLAAAFIGFILGAIAAYYVYREIVDDSHGYIAQSYSTSQKQQHGGGTHYYYDYSHDPNSSYQELRRLNTIDLIRTKPCPHNNTPYTPTSEAMTHEGGVLHKIDSPYQPEEGLRVYNTASMDMDIRSDRRKEIPEEEDEHHPLLPHEHNGGAIPSYQNTHSHGINNHNNHHHPMLLPGQIPGYYYPPQPLQPKHPIHQNPYQYFHTPTVDLSHQQSTVSHAPIEPLVIPPPPTGDHS